MTNHRKRIGLLSLTMIIAMALVVVASIIAPFLPGADAASGSVEISNFAFTPSSITIAPGDTVTWTNSDSVTHTVTGTGWGSGSLATGSTYARQFNTTGDFTYHCSIHPSMTGIVHVSSGTSPTPTTTGQSHMLFVGMTLTALIAVAAIVVVVVVVLIVVLMREDRSKKT